MRSSVPLRSKRLRTAALLCGLLLCARAAPLTAAPETIRAAGPAGEIRAADALLEWAGVPDALDNPVAAYRVQIDGGEPFLTFQTRLALYDLEPGVHSAAVAAVNGIPGGASEADPTPAAFQFAVRRDFQTVRGNADSPETAFQLQNGQTALRNEPSLDGYDWYRIDPEYESGRAVLHLLYDQQGGAPGSVSLYAGEPPYDAPAYVQNGRRIALAVGARQAGWRVRVQSEAAYRLTAYTAPLPEGVYRADDPTAPIRLGGGRAQAIVLGESEAAFRAALDIPSPRWLQIGFYRLGAEGEAALDAYAWGAPEPRRLAASLAANPANRQAGAAQVGAQLGEWLLNAYRRAEEPIGTYTVVLRVEEPPESALLELEPNGEPPSANELPLGSALSGSFSRPGDADLYRVEIPVRGTLAAQMNGALRVLSRGGETLADAPDGELQAELEPGEYWISAESPAAAYEPYLLAPFFVQEMRHNAEGTLPAGARVRASLRLLTDAEAHIAAPPLFPPTPMRDPDGDGVYEAELIVPNGAEGENLRIEARLRAGGATARALFPGGFSADGVPPRVQRIRHSASKPLRAGETWTIRVAGETGLTLIGALARPDGAVHRGGFPFEETADGDYEANVEILPQDHLDEGYARIEAADAAGNRSIHTGAEPAVIDTRPPRIDSVAASAEDGAVRVTAARRIGSRRAFLHRPSPMRRSTPNCRCLKNRPAAGNTPDRLPPSPARRSKTLPPASFSPTAPATKPPPKPPTTSPSTRSIRASPASNMTRRRSRSPPAPRSPSCSQAPPTATPPSRSSKRTAPRTGTQSR